MDVYGALASIPFLIIVVWIAVWMHVIYRRDLAIQQTNAQLDRPPEPWRPSAPTIEVAELESLIAATPALVVHCWAIWNGADRMIDRSWREVLPKWSDRLLVRSLDVDLPEFESIVQEWRVDAVPMTVCFRDGKRAFQRPGFMTRDQLDQLLVDVYGEAYSISQVQCDN